MANAILDGNRTHSLIGMSTISSTTPIPVKATPAGELLVTGAFTPSGNVLSSTPFNGQAKIAITGTAVQLASNTLVNGVIVIAKTTNAAAITVGGASVTNVVNGTGNGTILEPGMAMSWGVANTNVLYINGTANDIISFAGS